jgi:cell division protein FtsL
MLPEGLWKMFQKHKLSPEVGVKCTSNYSNSKIMKINPVIFKMLICTTIVFAFCNCSKPIEEKIDDAETKVQEQQSDLREAKQELNQVSTDSIRQVEEYLIVTQERLELNTQNLEGIKKELKSSKAISTSSFEEELSILEIRNRKLMAKANDSYEIQSDSWASVKTELNKEMDELEKAIADLQEKSRKKL